jgi:putative ABC transport system permease protein
MGERTGALAAIAIAIAAVADVVPSALAVHWDMLRQDLGYAARSLSRTPGFAITAVLVIALGVGANTAAFSLADFVLLRPLPFQEPDRLVKIWQSSTRYSGRNELSPANYRDWKAQVRSVSTMGAFTRRPANLVSTAEPRRLETVAMTPDLLPMLGVLAFAGRMFTPADSVDGRVVVLSHALWRTQFGGDGSVIGSSVRLDGEPFTVIGVMPPSFRFPSRETEAWIPLLLYEDDFADRNNNYLEGVARLAPGVSLDQARNDFASVARRLEEQFPKENKDTGALVIGLRDEIAERSRLLVVALCGATLCILLLACANLTSLFIARSTHRARELAVRVALGAGRERLVRQLVTESLGLALIGGIVGVLVAVAGVPLLAQLVPNTLPTDATPSVDLRVLLVGAALIGLTGLAFGIGPAVAAGNSSALTALREGARAGSGRSVRVRAALVITEVAASVVLLIASGLLLRAVMRLQATDPGFETEGVLTLNTTLPTSKYSMTARRDQFYGRVLGEVRALPGVKSAAYVTGLPMSMTGGIWPVAIAGDEQVVANPGNSVSLRFVTPQYFSTLGIRLLDGRDVAESDRRDSPWVAVVSESFVKRHWPNQRPGAMRFTIADSLRTIVGVVADVRVRGLERPSEPQVYLPATQMADSSLSYYPPKQLAVRAAGNVAGLVPAIRDIVRSVDPDQPISNVRMMSDIVDDQTAPRVIQIRLLAVLSIIALLVAGIGIHGLLTFTVSRRSQELGVRRALGEQPGSIVQRVMREGLILAIIGVGIGLMLGYLSGRAMGALLAGIQPADPATIATAAALCFGTAIVGCLRPAILAARVDPMTVLRGE